MRRSVLALVALSSWILVARCGAGTRPHYGGTLHVSLRASLGSLDPADESTTDKLALHNVCHLIYDTLVILDEKGKPQACLAVSWQAEPGNQRWSFRLRSGVTLQSGSPLTAEIVAASLRAANPNWKVSGIGSMVTIETDVASGEFPAQVALSRNAIALRDGGKVIGTGPFAIADWQPGKKLTLTAREDYWGGRPYVDSVEIELGRNLREQMIALDLGKSDVIEVAPEQAHRATAEGRRIASSAPLELVALVFRQARPSEDDVKLRQALGLCIDRSSLNTVILQGGGELAGGLLPNWLSGYAFLFPTGADVKRARELRNEVRQAPTWTLGYDNGDPAARMLAERIALNARDAGLSLRPTIAADADIQLVEIAIRSIDGEVALNSTARAVGINSTAFRGASIDELYQSENALLAAQQVIPLLHLRVNYGLSPAVKNWTQHADGGWRLDDVWLGAAKP